MGQLNMQGRVMETIGADCSRVARATTPGPAPQPHGWVRLGLEVSRFLHFWVGGLACAEFPRGVEFRGSLALFFLHILKQKKVICESRLQQIAHTVKFTKLTNTITPKRLLIVQSQKLVAAYTRPQVRIVSSYFTGNFNTRNSKYYEWPVNWFEN